MSSSTEHALLGAEPGPEEKAWQERRKLGIGASEVAPVFGVGRFHSRYALWALKTGRLDDDFVPSEFQHWGKILEPAICDEYSRRTGLKIKDHGRFNTVQHPDLDCLFATLDREILGDPRGPASLEVKNTGSHFRWEWEEVAPLPYQLQLQTQLEVKGWPWGALAVLIGGQEFKAIEAERDHELGQMILEAVGEFWRLVETDTPPETDATKSTERVLKKLHPKDNGQTLILDVKTQKLVDELSRTKAVLKEANEAKRGLDNELRGILKDVTFGLLPDGRTIQYRVEPRSGYTVGDSTPRVMRVKKEHPDPQFQKIGGNQ